MMSDIIAKCDLAIHALKHIQENSLATTSDPEKWDERLQKSALLLKA